MTDNLDQDRSQKSQRTRRQTLRQIGVIGTVGAVGTGATVGKAAADHEGGDGPPFVREFSGSCPDSAHYDFVGHHTVHTDYLGYSEITSGHHEGKYMHTYDICATGWAGRYWAGFPYYEDKDDASEGLYIHGHGLDFEPGDEDVYLPASGNDDDIIAAAPGTDADSLSDHQETVKTVASVLIDHVDAIGYARDANDIVNAMIRDDSSGTRDYEWEYGDEQIYGTGRTQADHFVRIEMLCDPGDNANGEFKSEVQYYFRSPSNPYHTWTISYDFWTPDWYDATLSTAEEGRTKIIDGEEHKVGPLRENPGDVEITAESS